MVFHSLWIILLFVGEIWLDFSCRFFFFFFFFFLIERVKGKEKSFLICSINPSPFPSFEFSESSLRRSGSACPPRGAPLSRRIILEHHRTPGYVRSFIPFPQNCPNLGNRSLFSPPSCFFLPQREKFLHGNGSSVKRRFSFVYNLLSTRTNSLEMIFDSCGRCQPVVKAFAILWDFHVRFHAFLSHSTYSP